jgi:hypothetical protein
MVALHPYFIVMSVLILSEAVFVPLMVASLWGLAVLWNSRTLASFSFTWRSLTLALGTGAVSGLAILVRPAWAFFVPSVLCISGIISPRGATQRLTKLRIAGAVMFGLCIVMMPWWVRNWQTYGRFVPSAVWIGASLYDGLNPDATGASNMRFLEDPDIWPLGELDQDAELGRRAREFVASHPGRALELAFVKLARYWSPWPNAEGFRSSLLAAASALFVVPILCLVFLGLCHTRKDVRAWILLAGSLLYFCGLHMIFASSMRYRVPAEVPAMGLAAIGLRELASKEHRQKSIQRIHRR